MTLALAIWGALLSTVLAIRTLWQDRREDGRLRTRVYIGRTFDTNSIKPNCSFEVVNIGRRPAYLGGVILHDKEGKFLAQVLGPPLEGYVKLDPGEVCEPRMGDTYDDVDKMVRIHRVFTLDSKKGRIYLSRWKTWRMRREIDRIVAEGRALPARSEQQLT